MKKFEIEYTMMGTGIISVWAENLDEAEHEFFCSKQKDLIECCDWEDALEVIDITDLGEEDEEEDEEEEDQDQEGE